MKPLLLVFSFIRLIAIGLAGDVSHAANLPTFVGISHVETSVFSLSMPKIADAVIDVRPLPLILEPGASPSPIFQEFLKCTRLSIFCKKEFAAELTVQVKRIRQPDDSLDQSNEQHLQYRVNKMLTAGALEAKEKARLYKKKVERLNPESLQIINLGKRLWARVDGVGVDDRSNGRVYWTMIDDQYMIGAGLLVEPDVLPTGVTVDALNLWFESFVQQIDIVKK